MGTNICRCIISITEEVFYVLFMFKFCYLNYNIQDKLKLLFEKSYGQGKIDVVKSGTW